jgi:hypothetical protein
MRNFWVVQGGEANWRQALMSKGIWGLEDTRYDKVYWLAVSPGDAVLFYVTGSVRGIVGYGVVRNKFYQEKPLWQAEIASGRARWPLRFEFDVEFLLPYDRWHDEKVSLPGGGKFREPLILVDRSEVAELLRVLNPSASIENLLTVSLIPAEPPTEEVASPTHDEIKAQLVEIGKLQQYLASAEFPMGNERLDAVWRRLPESVPTYAFEVQVGGDVYHALGKLKHAHDLWNSRIFLVSSRDDLGNINQLLSGTFHEIQPVIRVIDTDSVQSLHTSKRDIYRIEKELGIIP